ncbi:aldose epimerase family protein [Sulfitobacter geojensis]|uniref:aldose epimerase family protein n=1 Tax=Sulfitobacter geojensis TaxID=1342299 RepID=UPI0036DAB1EE
MPLEPRPDAGQLAGMTLNISSDDLTVTILPRGATLNDIRLRQQNRPLVLGFRGAQDHQRIPVCAGAIVGPVANRITAGKIEIDATQYQMPLNEAGRTSLHSGPAGLHTLTWDVIEHSSRLLKLAVTLADGDHGLPGLRRITAQYSLEGPIMRLEMTATTDRPTPMNLAHHPYWNLGGIDIADHQLQLAADHYLPTDAHSLPTGHIASTSDTLFDFTQPKRIPLTAALDVNFCLSLPVSANPAPCATLTGPDGTRLDVATTAAGLQVYGGAFLPDRKGVLHEAKDLRPYGGIALEPQCWPDAPHQPHFPQITLRPDEVWQQITTYKISPPPTS